MERGRRRHDRGVDARVDQLAHAPSDGQVPGDAETVAARVGERHQVDAAGRAGVAHVVAPH